MKKFISSIVLFLVITGSAFAQTATSYFDSGYKKY